MIFHQLHAERGCCSYLIGCPTRRIGLVVDPILELVDQYLAIASREGLSLRYALDTHTHADHFTGTRELKRRTGALIVMHAASRAPFIDVRVHDGELLRVGELRARILHTPGHTTDGVCLVLDDRVLTGDTLLINGCGRTDFPGGSAEALHASLFERLLTLPAETRVYPGHDYRRLGSSTIEQERAGNPRLQRTERSCFVAFMGSLALNAPDHLTEALRTNLTGAETVEQMLADAAARVPFMGMDELERRLGDDRLVILDVRDGDAYRAGHIPGARHIPRGELELRVNQAFPVPGVRIVCYCQYGKISTLAAATLRDMGFSGAAALDGGFGVWVEAGRATDSGRPTEK
ncbi:MAG: glyoxylase-like metal-dependent hydrolase (beta-lactamase superfamily II) [Myxococcota bacterium]|jgi:glyoxylase-like metal-dependent hydrolase (beta-lactamase superfamily II)/rhodanese-related sulfurtransferase